MNTRISLHQEDGQGVNFGRSVVASSSLGNEYRCVEFCVGDAVIDVFFKSFSEFEAFCLRHNIAYEDERK